MDDSFHINVRQFYTSLDKLSLTKRTLENEIKEFSYESRIDKEESEIKMLQDLLLKERQLMKEKISYDEVAKLIVEFPSNEQFLEQIEIESTRIKELELQCQEIDAMISSRQTEMSELWAKIQTINASMKAEKETLKLS